MTADLAIYRLVMQRGVQPFAWGKHDCVLWACDVVHATTGRDPGADLRGTYSTWPEAAAKLRQLGGLQALAAARFGTPVPVAEAADGDVALLDRGSCVGEGSECGALGVVWRGLVLAQGDIALVCTRLDKVRHLWRPQA